MLRTLIIEDELDAQALLQTILNEYQTDIDIIGVSGCINEAETLINSLEPELIFLDIELENGSCFELLERIDYKKYKIIFTTAFQEYALKAFKYEALDYLLKPYSPRQVTEALSRVRKLMIQPSTIKELQQLLSQAYKPSNRKITINTTDGVHFFQSDNILRVEADRSYSFLYLTHGEKKLVSKPLKDLEGLLVGHNFFRTHASHLININHLKKIANQDGGYAEMVDGSQVPIARRRRQEFLSII